MAATTSAALAGAERGFAEPKRPTSDRSSDVGLGRDTLDRIAREAVDGR